MGSYTHFVGEIICEKINDEKILTIKQELELGKYFFSKQNCENSTIEKLTFSDRWKNFNEEACVGFVGELARTFSKYSVGLKGTIWCNHEYGDFWKVEFNNSEVILFEGIEKYKEKKVVKL